MATELRISSTPWELSNTSPAERGPVVIKSTSGLYVASVATVPDARLMCAAPDLLAALESVLSEIGAEWDDSWSSVVYEEAVEAIAKARGEDSRG